ncbi:MAG: hypothetical protein N5P05_004595 [Chroococcopsis gigantea SAG 12.99]|nr:hypothetical protein [Chroococcopsis gigantea SAG 12.99]
MTHYKPDGVDDAWLWICDSVDAKLEAKKAMRFKEGFILPTANSEVKADGWRATNFRTDASGPTRLVDIAWVIDDDEKQYSQEEILNLAKEALQARKAKAMM